MRNKKKKSGLLKLKIVIFIMLFGALLAAFQQFFPNEYDKAVSKIECVYREFSQKYFENNTANSSGKKAFEQCEFVVENYLPKSLDNSKKVEILKNIGYVAGYSQEHQIPLWSVYSIEYPFKYKSEKRPSSFIKDTRIANCPQHSDYTATSYDRGHLSPNYAVAVCFGTKAQKETFLLTNIVPQKPELNRGVWKDIEALLVNKMSKNFEKLIVVAGVIVPKDYKRLKGKMAIPSKCYMAILAKKKDSSYYAIAFLVEQYPTKKSIKDYVCSVNDLENISLFDFFSNLDDAIEEDVESNKDINYLLN